LGNKNGNRILSKRPWQSAAYRKFKKSKPSKNGGIRRAGEHKKKRQWGQGPALLWRVIAAEGHEAREGGEVVEGHRKAKAKGEGVKVHRAGDGAGVGVLVWVKDKVTAQRLHDKGTVHTYLHIDVTGMG
jgi:hypothetical protein